jgi:hypothetical protein
MLAARIATIENQAHAWNGSLAEVDHADCNVYMTARICKRPPPELEEMVFEEYDRRHEQGTCERAIAGGEREGGTMDVVRRTPPEDSIHDSSLAGHATRPRTGARGSAVGRPPNSSAATAAGPPLDTNPDRR